MPWMNGGRTWRIGAALLAAGLVAGCALSDEKAASLLVAPGDYDLYSCPQLAQTAASLRTKRVELEALMARAETDSGGRMMSALGYRPEYLKVRGELHEIDATAREKHCDLSAVPLTDKPPAPSPVAPPASPRMMKPR